MIKVDGIKTKLPVTHNITENIKRLKHTKKNLMIKYYDLYTELVKAKDIKHYQKQYTDLVNEINTIENDIDTSYMNLEELNRSTEEKEYIYIDYIVIDADAPLSEPIVPPPIIKKINVEKKAAIKKNIKDLMAQVFPFKNKKECESKKKSEAYYLSKEDLVNKIKQQPEIESKMPPKYSKMTKEKICEQLFS